MILTALWKRPEISEISLRNNSRLDSIISVLSRDDCNFIENYRNASKYGEVCVINNYPLGRKFNFGLKKALELEWDNLIVVGSDDLISPKAFEKYDDSDVQGFSGFHIWDTKTGRLKWNSGNGFQAIGAGRRFKRDVLERLSWDLWDNNINRGLDTSSVKTLGYHRIEERIIDSKGKPYIVDMKSDVNIWAFDDLQGININPVLDGYFDKDIIESLKGLQ